MPEFVQQGSFAPEQAHSFLGSVQALLEYVRSIHFHIPGFVNRAKATLT